MKLLQHEKMEIAHTEKQGNILLNSTARTSYSICSEGLEHQSGSAVILLVLLSHSILSPFCSGHHSFTRTKIQRLLQGELCLFVLVALVSSVLLAPVFDFLPSERVQL